MDENWYKRLKYAVDSVIIHRQHPKKFDGKIYYMFAPSVPRPTAEQSAKWVRDVGYLARISETKYGYEVYIRRK